MNAAEDHELRDELALERTRLANERTLLAYVRTALATGAAGAVLLHFFSDQVVLRTLAAVLMLGGGFILVLGAWRFWQVRRRLAAGSR